MNHTPNKNELPKVVILHVYSFQSNLSSVGNICTVNFCHLYKQHWSYIYSAFYCHLLTIFSCYATLTGENCDFSHDYT